MIGFGAIFEVNSYIGSLWDYWDILAKKKRSILINTGF